MQHWVLWWVTWDHRMPFKGGEHPVAWECELVGVVERSALGWDHGKSDQRAHSHSLTYCMRLEHPREIREEIRKRGFDVRYQTRITPDKCTRQYVLCTLHPRPVSVTPARRGTLVPGAWSLLCRPGCVRT